MGRADERLLDYVVCPCNPWNGRNSEACMIDLPDGRLLLTWSCWTAGSGHDQATAEIRGKISENKGETWSDSFLWQAHGHYRAAIEPGLAWLRTGELCFTYSARLAEKHEGYEGVQQSILSFFKKSADGGITWTKPKLINPEGLSLTVVFWDKLRVSATGRVLAGATTWWRDPLPSDPDERDRSRAFVLYSDDDGESWRMSNALIVEEARGFEEASEPWIEQFSDGTWIMMIRNSTGRPFRSFSTDDGATWSRPEPVALASATAPIAIRRIPGTDDLLTVWNQVSKKEIRAGHPRHRLSAAITKDRGKTWTHFRNLESNDTRVYVEPEPIDGPVKRDPGRKGHTPLQASETEHELTGSRYTNCSYAAILFFEGCAFLTYDISGPGEPGGLKFRRMPIEWFYDA
ncbi:MAG: sialidase family protein [Planctomycetota bacterium]